VLTERRRILHGRIGTALEKLNADRLEDHLPELAHHFARSADTAKAVEYLFKAGQYAAQRSASRQALDQVETGLRLLESLFAGAARDQQELEVRGAMWMPLLELRGPASPESWRNMKRAQDLCDQRSAPTEIVFQVLNGLWNGGRGQDPGHHTGYAMGAIYPTVPAGCATPNVGGTTYYLCGNTWFQPAYGANGVYYRVVPSPGG
jgi:hypothetical protein